jgi:hypothetical protein
VLADVIGIIRGISDVATLKLPGSNVAVSRRHILLDDGRYCPCFREL